MPDATTASQEGAPAENGTADWAATDHSAAPAAESATPMETETKGAAEVVKKKRTKKHAVPYRAQGVAGLSDKTVQVRVMHSVHGRTSPARFCHVSCLHPLLLHAPQPPAKLQHVKRCRLLAFPARATKWKMFCQEICPLAEPSAKGSEVLPRTLVMHVPPCAGLLVLQRQGSHSTISFPHAAQGTPADLLTLQRLGLPTHPAPNSCVPCWTVQSRMIASKPTSAQTSTLERAKAWRVSGAADATSPSMLYRLEGDYNNAA